MKLEIWKKIEPLVGAGNLTEAIELLKDGLAKSENSLDACLLAKDLGFLYFRIQDETRAVQYFTMASEGFIREGQLFQAISMIHELEGMAGGEQRAEQLKSMNHRDGLKK